MTRFYVTAPNPRPDFRLVIAFLWRDGQNVDTDGDCDHPASHEWNELFVANREQPSEPPVSIYPHQQSPLVLVVESAAAHLATRLAYFLATSVRGGVSQSPEDEFASPVTLLAQVGDFDLEAAMRRATGSPFSRDA
jgi:TorA maturation chaperone TorD